MNVSLIRTPGGIIRFEYQDGSVATLSNLTNIYLRNSATVIYMTATGVSRDINYVDIVNINGAPKPVNIESTKSLLSETVFIKGGGDGLGSQLPDDFFISGVLNPKYLAPNSISNETTVPLYEEELNELYGDMGARFLVFCDMLGSGMTYYKVTSDDNSKWYNWPTSRAVNQQ